MSLDTQKTAIQRFRVTGGIRPENISPWTAEERQFIDLLAQNVKLCDAKRSVGFSAQRANAFMARADVKEACHRQRRAYLMGMLVPTALQGSLALMEDDETPKSTKAALYRAILKMASDMEESDAKADRPQGGDMTLNELADIARQLRSDIGAIEADFEEIPPDDGLGDLF